MSKSHPTDGPSMSSGEPLQLKLNDHASGGRDFDAEVSMGGGGRQVGNRGHH